MSSQIIDAQVVEPQKDEGKTLLQKAKTGLWVAGISVTAITLMFVGFRVMAALQDEGAKTIEELNQVISESQQSKRTLTIEKKETESKLAVLNSDIANLDVRIAEAQLKIARLVNGEDAASVKSGTGSSSSTPEAAQDF